MWWQVPVIPATWEAQEGESLEPRRRRLQCTIALQPAQQEQNSISKKKDKEIEKPGITVGDLNILLSQ